MSRLLITGSRAHQWTPYDSHALLSDEEKNLIIRICSALGETTGIGTELSERVCSEDPWLHARGNKKAHDPGDTLIPKIAMGVYYFEHPILH